MAQPKKKLSSTRGNRRRSHLHLKSQPIAVCSHCQATTASHTVCQACGYYKGVPVLPIKAQAK